MPNCPDECKGCESGIPAEQGCASSVETLTLPEVIALLGKFVVRTFTADEVVDILGKAIRQQLTWPDTCKYSVVNEVLEENGITHKRFDEFFEVLEVK